MNAKTRQPRGNETQGRRVVVGRIVFSFNAQVLKVIDLDETDMKSDKKIEIVKNELGKLVKLSFRTFQGAYFSNFISA